MDKKLVGQATEEQIKEWKKAHADVFKIEVEDSVCYLHAPDRKLLDYVISLKDKPMRANEVLLENCWLGGDETIKTNDSKFLSISSNLAKIIEIKESEVTKL